MISIFVFLSSFNISGASPPHIHIGNFVSSCIFKINPNKPFIAPLTIAFRDMEFEGLLIDEDKMNELDHQLQEKIKLADIALRAAAGLEEDANLNSTNQLVNIIYSFEKNDEGEWVQVDNFGLGLYPFEFTKKGAPSTNEETLSKVKSMVEEEFTARGLKVE